MITQTIALKNLGRRPVRTWCMIFFVFMINAPFKATPIHRAFIDGMPDPFQSPANQFSESAVSRKLLTQVLVVVAQLGPSMLHILEGVLIHQQLQQVCQICMIRAKLQLFLGTILVDNLDGDLLAAFHGLRTGGQIDTGHHGDDQYQGQDCENDFFVLHTVSSCISDFIIVKSSHPNNQYLLKL